MYPMRLPILGSILLLGALAGCGAAPAAPVTAALGEPLLVAAASDLQNAFTEIAALYRQQTGKTITLTFGSSGQLTQQIENGAPYDLFAAADEAYVKSLEAKGLTIPETTQLYARGRIVLAVNRKSGLSLTDIRQLSDASVAAVAIANPDHAPYGRAAMQALQAAGVWDAVKPKVVYGDNVSQALQFVQTGNAPAGIVALSIAGVPEIGYTLIDAGLHEPLNQRLTVLKRSARAADARAFIALVNGAQGRPLMQKFGFTLPGEN